jgi:hypothetical protein
MGVLLLVGCVGVSFAGVRWIDLERLFSGVVGVIPAGLWLSLDGSASLGGTNFNESIINGIMTGIFVFRNFGYSWNSSMTVNGHSVRTRKDCLDGSDGMLSFGFVDSVVNIGVDEVPVCMPSLRALKSKFVCSEPPSLLFSSL